jgi:thymidylate kinase
LWTRSRGELIVFDRYYYDYLIQPGISLPHWLISSGFRLIPQPDLIFYLKNNPAVILSRKAELTKDELERQGRACDDIISRLRSGVVVKTTGKPEDTILEVGKIIIDKLASCSKSNA